MFSGSKFPHTVMNLKVHYHTRTYHSSLMSQMNPVHHTVILAYNNAIHFSQPAPLRFANHIWELPF
jgi:hypothetical protein